MDQRVDEAIEKENFLYERLSGASSTANTFYPYDACIEHPIAILQKFIVDLEALGSVDNDLTKHQYVTSLGREVVDALGNDSLAPERKRQLLFDLYLHCCIASTALQDRFGFTTTYWQKFSSREEAVLFGWTLTGSQLSEDDKKDMQQCIVDYYSKRGIKLTS